MDKKTLSHYGWIVVLILILSVLLAFMTPLGSFIAGGFKSITGGFFDTNGSALDVINKIPPDKCSHTSLYLTGAKNPTCKENGYTGDQVCQGCGTVMEVGSPIDKLAHTIAIDNAVAPTCDNKGKTEGEHCSVCKTVLVAQRDIDALGHDWGDSFIAEEATCIGNGISRSTCKRAGCDGKQDTTIDAKGHTIATIAGYAATCTEKGLSSGEKCSVCGHVQKAQTEIPANGHTQQKTAAIAATCETDGKTEGIKCSVCKVVIKEVSTVAKLGHQMGTATTTLTANCERNGQIKTNCQRNGCNYYEVETIPALGHNTVVDNAVAPTCTETGLTAGLHCIRCSYKMAQDTVAALGHDKVADKAVEATCTTDGKTAGEHCTRCSYKVAQNVIAALGHNTVEDKAVAPTCTATGLTVGGHCTRCNHTVAQEVVPALGHSTVTDNAVAPTCTKTGLTEGEHCTRCSYIKAQQTVAALGHDVITDKAVSATCTTTGLTQGEHCSRCSYKVAQSVVSALGHNTVTDNAVAPTCTETGLTEGEHCTRCSYKVAQTTVAKLGHQMGGDVIVSPATCTTDGQTKSSCTRNGCSHYTTSVIGKLGHNMITDNAVAPTCTTAGLSIGEHCSRCDHTVAQEVIPALGHTIVTDQAVAATCITTGLTRGEHCSRCNYEVEQEVVAALGHDIVVDDGVAATCVTSGLTAGEHCSRCNHKVEREVIEALDHNFGTAEIVAEADCVVNGETIAHCTRDNCEAIKTGIIEATGHNMVNDDAVAATCTTDGKTAGSHCTKCLYKEGGEIIKAFGHEYNAVATKEATCTSEGSITYTCVREDDSYTETIGMLNHNIIYLEEVPATCTQTGLSEGAKCSSCGLESEREVIEVLGHDYNEVITKEATCTQDGEIKHTCSRCGDAYTIIKNGGHIDETGCYLELFGNMMTFTGKQYVSEEFYNWFINNAVPLDGFPQDYKDNGGYFMYGTWKVDKVLKWEEGMSSISQQINFTHNFGEGIYTGRTDQTETDMYITGKECDCGECDRLFAEVEFSTGKRSDYYQWMVTDTKDYYCDICGVPVMYGTWYRDDYAYSQPTVHNVNYSAFVYGENCHELKTFNTMIIKEQTTALPRHGHEVWYGSYMAVSVSRPSLDELLNGGFGADLTWGDAKQEVFFGNEPQEVSQEFHDWWFRGLSTYENTYEHADEIMYGIKGDDTTYFALDGMTWTELLSGNKYDTSDYIYINNGYLMIEVDDEILNITLDGENVKATDKIHGGRTYWYGDPETHEHDYVTIVIKETTCTESGSVMNLCGCGDSTTTTTNALGHEYNRTEKEATCEEDGEIKYTCIRGDHEYSETIKGGHIDTIECAHAWPEGERWFDFTEKQYVSEDFYNWMVMNAVPEEGNVEDYIDEGGYFVDGKWNLIYDEPIMEDGMDTLYQAVKFNSSFTTSRTHKNVNIVSGVGFDGECNAEHVEIIFDVGSKVMWFQEHKVYCKTTYDMGDGVFHFATKQYLEIDQGATEMSEELYQWFLENTTRVDQAGPAILKDANGYYMEGSVKFNESLTALPEEFHTDEYSWFIWVDFDFTYDNITGFGRIAISSIECEDCGKVHTYIDAWKGKGLYFFYKAEEASIDYYCDRCGEPIIYGTFYRDGYAFPENTGNTIHKVDYGFYTNSDQDEFVMSNKIQISLDAGTDSSGWYKDSVTSYWNSVSDEMMVASYLFKNEAQEDDLTWGGVDQYIFFGDEIQVTTQEFHDWFFAGYYLACPEIPTPDGFEPIEDGEKPGTTDEGLKLNTVYYGVLEDDGSDINHRMIKDYALVFQEDGTVWVFEDTICPAVVCISDDSTYTLNGDILTLDGYTQLKFVDSDTIYHHDMWGVYFGYLYAQQMDTSGVKYETVYDEVWNEGEKFVFHDNNTVTFTNRYGNSTVLNVEWSENSKYICNIEGLGIARIVLEENRVYCPSVTSWPTTPEDGTIYGGNFYYDALYSGEIGTGYFIRNEAAIMVVRVWNSEAKESEFWMTSYSKDENDKWIADGYFEPLYGGTDGTYWDDYGTTYTFVDKETVDHGFKDSHALIQQTGQYTLDKEVVIYGLHYETEYTELDTNDKFVFHNDDTVTVTNGEGKTRTFDVRWDAPMYCYIEGYGSIYIELNGYGVDYVMYSSELFETVALKIDGITYQADKNTTWEEWVASPYNTNGYVIENGEIYTSDKKYKVSGKKSTDTITSNETITVTRVSSGPNTHGGGSN